MDFDCVVMPAIISGSWNSGYLLLSPIAWEDGTVGPIPWIYYASCYASLDSEGETGHCSTGLQLASGLNSLIEVAVSVVVFPKSLWSRTPSWLMMKVITPELPYSAG